MNKFTTALFAAAALIAAPALASPGNSGNNGNNGNGNNGNNGSSIAAGFNVAAGQGFGFEGAGEATGSSASGFQMDVTFRNPSVAAFGSVGTAGSSVEVTPFSVTTDSNHAGAFAGFTLGNAKLDGQVMNFGQSTGEVAFDVNAWQFGEFSAFGSFED